MPRTCTVCVHPDCEAIDRLLITGTPLRDIAGRFAGISKSALDRHRDDHLPRQLTAAKEADEAAHADDLLAQLRALQSRTLQILDDADDDRTALMAVREARNTIELMAKLMHELETAPTVNVLVAPQWALVHATIIDALAPYPDARIAVAGALADLEAS